MFEYRKRIGMRDVDAAGVLFFARYLSLVHEACEEMFARHDLSFKTHVDKHGVVFPVIHAKTDYRRPFFIGDTAGIQLTVSHISSRTYTTAFKFLNNEKLAAEGHLVQACVSCSTHGATSLPESIIDLLRAYSC